jgi:hypothetical protein
MGSKPSLSAPSNIPPPDTAPIAAMSRAEPRPKSVQWLLDPDTDYVPEFDRREEAEETPRRRPRLYPVALAASAAVILGGAAYLALPALNAELFDSEPKASPVSLNDAPVLTVGPLNSEPQAAAPSQAEPPAPVPIIPKPAAAPPPSAAVVLPPPVATVSLPDPVVVALAMPLPHPIELQPATPPPPALSPVPPHPVVVTLAMPLPHPIELQPATRPPAPSPVPPHPVVVTLAMPLPHPIELQPVAAPHPDKPAATPAPPPHMAIAQIPAVRAVAAATRIVRAAELHFNVRLSFTTNEAASAATFARALRQQGFTVTSIVIPATLGRWPGVAYFYESDRDKALLIARQLTALTGTHEHARLSPRHPYPGPGTVEVSLLGDPRPKSRGPDKQARAKRLS